jgi:hypothetical protein
MTINLGIYFNTIYYLFLFFTYKNMFNCATVDKTLLSSVFQLKIASLWISKNVS